jgi:hypothetical protein
MNSALVKEPAQVQQYRGFRGWHGAERSKSSFDLHLHTEGEKAIEFSSVGGDGCWSAALRQEPSCFDGTGSTHVNVGKGAGDEARLRGASRYHLVRDSCQHIYLGRDKGASEVLAKCAQVGLLHQQLTARGNAGNQNLTARTQVGATREKACVKTGGSPEKKCWRAGYGGARAGGQG